MRSVLPESSEGESYFNRGKKVNPLKKGAQKRDSIRESPRYCGCVKN